MNSIDKESHKVKTEIEKPINSTNNNETYVIHEVNEDDEYGEDE